MKVCHFEQICNLSNLPFCRASPSVALPKLQKFNELGYETAFQSSYLSVISPTDYNLCEHFQNFLKMRVLEAGLLPKLSSLLNAFAQVLFLFVGYDVNGSAHKSGTSLLTNIWREG
ncbi:hypothetical protein KIN20_033235 [Parelaphostrongylus tenuis]|uniref:Uncharacterized protein n=1 Tax=Parelaphostrongylus tenuis TaxID=148309 RepID=A0AAD5R8B0_PARTN|nr:hypothetical protein KIN20_033235 [Parelaphostrongylus tenuis]